MSQALSRGEAKDSILLSSRDRYLLEPTECVSKEAHLGPSKANVWRNQGAGREQCHVLDVVLSDPAVLTLLEP